MANRQRAKKDDERQDQKTAIRREGQRDERQNVDQPDVRQPQHDQFDSTLEANSKRTKRGRSNPQAGRK